MNSLLLIAGVTIGLCLLFGAAFFVARRLDNYGLVDVVWSYAFAGVALVYALASPGHITRRAVLAGLIVAWSVRLGTHLALRVAHHHPQEDVRYQQLRRDWSENFSRRMFGFFQLQAVSVIALATPFTLSMRHTAVFPHPLEIAGLALFAIALAGEAIADRQLAVFKRANPASPTVCDIGLWRYSRHPNYFFEWLVWVAFALFAFASPWGWLGLISPLAMLYLLLRVTGIPLTEAQSMRRRGDAYLLYQRTTSAFFPWPPRKH